jgi:hypothetical protein
MHCQSGKIFNFVLDSEELSLVSKKRPQTQLAFAVMLKFFQKANKYPSDIKSIPLEMIDVLSNQLSVPPQSVEKFEWTLS